MNNHPLNNKICWVVGASTGIGAALSIALSRTGAKLILSSRNRSALESLRTTCEAPGRVRILHCDLEQQDTLEGVAADAWSFFKGIDYVFLNAGIAVRDLAMHTDVATVQKVMAVNFFGNAALTKALLPLMIHRGRGHFVVTSSLCGRFGVPKLAAYSASKHALHGYFESVQAEHNREGILVTMLTSGFVKTNITVNGLKGNGTQYGEMQASVANGITTEDCAEEIISAVVAKKREVLVGGFEKYGVLIKRFFPAVHAYFMDKHPLRRLRNIAFRWKALSQAISGFALSSLDR